MKNRTAPMCLVFAAALLFTSASASLGASPDFSDMQKRPDEAAKQGRIVYSEKGFTLNRTYHPPGCLSEVSFKGVAAHGATTKTYLEAGYLPGTVLEVEGRVTVAKGFYNQKQGPGYVDAGGQKRFNIRGQWPGVR